MFGYPYLFILLITISMQIDQADTDKNLMDIFVIEGCQLW